jgi:hypothetical protein
VEKTVFWSRQSDLDGCVTRELVRSALDQAIGIISADLDEADRPSLTSDTQGVARSPDIVATILRKIDEAAVFVGDVTPIAVSADGKACANPNVLIELGYAHGTLGESRVLQVWNTAFDGSNPRQAAVRHARAPRTDRFSSCLSVPIVKSCAAFEGILRSAWQSILVWHWPSCLLRFPRRFLGSRILLVIQTCGSIAPNPSW